MTLLSNLWLPQRGDSNSSSAAATPELERANQLENVTLGVGVRALGGSGGDSATARKASMFADEPLGGNSPKLSRLASFASEPAIAVVAAVTATEALTASSGASTRTSTEESMDVVSSAKHV